MLTLGGVSIKVLKETGPKCCTSEVTTMVRSSPLGRKFMSEIMDTSVMLNHAHVLISSKKTSFLEGPLILRYTELPAKMILSTSCFEELFHVVIVDVKRYMKEAHQKSLEILHQHT